LITSPNNLKKSQRTHYRNKTAKNSSKVREEHKKTKYRKSKNRKEHSRLNQSMNSPNYYSQVTQETCIIKITIFN